ncbi:MAG TPA: CheR family methyltransferase [Kofleriaceae bacterium]|jgi:chemotaxis methyl-accepting protein methylase|nr:CheR family methyltransferase [Kofleriaceae bacterium]
MALPPDTLAAIAQRLAEHAGLELPAWVVDARASARIAVVGGSPADYVALIDSPRGAGELAELIEAVRVGESRLFRHRPQIDALADAVAPALRARGRRAIRAWSAGCAAGEEPYTLAIVLSRALPDCAISILATDVSGEALARARTASYPRAALDHVPPAYRDAFLDDGERVRVAPELAARVRFERANLLDGAAPRDCDLVWCRNVLIYFTAEARRRAIERLVAATVPGGFVFVGYSETLRDVPALDTRRAGDAVYYVRREAEAPRARPPTQPVPVDRRPAAAPLFELASRPSAPRWASSVAPEDRTPPPIVFPPVPPANDTLALFGRPSAVQLTAEISTRLALPGLRSLTIDVDGAELLDDELAPVLRRARAAAWTAGIEFGVSATRTGALRWIARHGLGAPETTAGPHRPPTRPT